MNIYDIAREAGVSIATVSRVLNHKDTVRADTRAKVEKVLKRCNYAPSAIAQGMVSKSLHTVAVLTVDIRDSHYARTAYTIEREFGRRGYEVILCNTGGDRAETLRTLQSEVAQAYQQMLGYGKEFVQASKKSDAAQLAYEAVSGKYERGMVSALDLQTAADRLLEARSERLRARLQYIVKARLVAYYNGEPLIR